MTSPIFARILHRRHQLARKAVMIFVALATSIVPVVALAAPAHATVSGDVVSLVNTLRSTLGAPALAVDAGLTSVAQQWAVHMAAIDSLAHNPNLATQAPSGWTKMGENVGDGFSVIAVFNALVASPPHHANMVDPAYNRTGVGVAVDTKGQFWIVEDFGDYPPPVPAVMTFPTAGTVIFPSAQTFTWGMAPGGQYYCVTVGTTKGGVDLVNSGQLPASALSYHVPALPGGPLWVRIYTYTQGAWIFTDANITVTGASTAVLTFPTNGATNVDTTKPFTWSPVAAAGNYKLSVGTTKGGTDLVNSATLPASQTSYQTPALPAGKVLWARLSSYIAGSWNHYSDISFTRP